MERTLDRRVEFDERSKLYPAIRGIEDVTLRSYLWNCNIWNDQGKEGACVGFSWSHELAAEPAIVPTNNQIALNIYNKARTLDQWPGEDYEGTSVLAGAKAVQQMLNAGGLSLMPEYRWAFGIEDVVKTLAYKGPVVFGINWYSNMFNTDYNGFVHVGGQIAGGHAILGRGIKLYKRSFLGGSVFSNVDLSRSYVILRNSWGQNWGMNGDAKLSLSDLNILLNQEGECCVPVIRNT